MHEFESLSRFRRRLLALLLAVIAWCAPSYWLRWSNPAPLSRIHEPRYQWVDAMLDERGDSLRLVAVGSSGIRSSLDTEAVSLELYGAPGHAANFGLNWRGRGRDWVVARETLQRSSVETLVLEVGFQEVSVEHPYFVRLTDLPELLDDVGTITLPQILIRENVRPSINFTISVILGSACEGYAELLEGVLAPRPHVLASDPELAGTAGFRPLPPRWIEPFPARPAATYVPRDGFRGVAYLRRIAELCRDHGTQLVFFLVPYVGQPGLSPEYRALLSSLGKVVEYPDLTRLDDPSFWFNETHPSSLGARLLTEHFIAEMK